MSYLNWFVRSFSNRAGNYVLISTIISRLLSFLASWLALQFINYTTLGMVLYSWTIITFLVPFIGFGLPQSLIRYGALAKTDEEKNSLLSYVLKYGLITSIALTIIVFLFGLYFPFEFSSSGIYLAYLSLVFVPLFFFETLKIQFRLEHRNKMFSFLDFIYNLILVVLVLILTYYFKEAGYIIAILLAPTLSSLLFFKKISRAFKTLIKPQLINLEFWKYGFFGGLSNIANMLLLAIDVLLIGSLLNDAESVTIYRYIALIPLSTLFLPRVFIATDFVTFTENIRDQNYIYKYIKSYITLFSILSLCYLLVCNCFSTIILSLFDQELATYRKTFITLNFGVTGILILRGLFGNLLSSIGRVKTNYYITVTALGLNVISNIILLPKFGLMGAAITSSSIMWLTGIASAIAFFYYYKKDFIA